MQIVNVNNVEIGAGKLAVLAGPCVAESLDLCLEIAERMNLSVNTIKTHYSEALKLLRIHLSKMLIIVAFTTLMTFLSVHLIK